MDPITSTLALLPEPYAHDAGVALGCFAILSGLCSMADAWLPQPVAGSKWVVPRKLIAILAHNYAYAANRIPPGLPRPVQQIEAVVDAAVRAEASPVLAPGSVTATGITVSMSHETPKD